MKSRSLLACGCIVTCVLFSACGRRDVNVVTPDGKAKINISGGNIVVTGPDGAVATVDASGGKIVAKGPKGEVVVSDPSTGQVIAKGADGQTVINSGQGKSTIEFKGKEGAGTFQAGDNVALPKSWAKDIPLYPGAKVMAALDSPTGQQVQFTTKDPLKKISEYYTDKLNKDGWKQESMVQADTTFTMSSKKDTRRCVVIVSQNEDDTFLTLTVAPQN